MVRNRVYGLIILFLFIVLIIPFCYAETLKVTSEHPFLVNGSWIPAKQLKAGDELATSDGKTAVIDKINYHPEQVQVYNLEDNYFHNYILSSGLVVHNSQLFVGGKLNKDFLIGEVKTALSSGKSSFEFILADGTKKTITWTGVDRWAGLHKKRVSGSHFPAFDDPEYIIAAVIVKYASYFGMAGRALPYSVSISVGEGFPRVDNMLKCAATGFQGRYVKTLNWPVSIRVEDGRPIIDFYHAEPIIYSFR